MTSYKMVYGDEDNMVTETYVNIDSVVREDGWLVLYNCDEPRGIQARFAHAPTASWSEQASVFEPWRDNGYCHFMHAPDCDAVNDPGRETEWGGEYGPYLVEPLTQPTEHGAVIGFVMSTWNPYATVLMRSELAWR